MRSYVGKIFYDKKMYFNGFFFIIIIIKRYEYDIK